MTDRVGVQMLHHYEPRLLFRLIGGRRKPLAPRSTLRFLLRWRVAASPRRKKLIPTRYLPHRLLVTRVPHLVRYGACMCSQLQPGRGVFHGFTFLSSDHALAAPRPSRIAIK